MILVFCRLPGYIYFQIRMCNFVQFVTFICLFVLGKHTSEMKWKMKVYYMCLFLWFMIYLLKCGTIWSDLKQPTTSKKRSKKTCTMRNDLKRPSEAQKRPEMTWNNQQLVRNDKKRPETTYKEHKTTWDRLQLARNNL